MRNCILFAVCLWALAFSSHPCCGNIIVTNKSGSSVYFYLGPSGYPAVGMLPSGQTPNNGYAYSSYYPEYLYLWTADGSGNNGVRLASIAGDGWRYTYGGYTPPVSNYCGSASVTNSSPLALQLFGVSAFDGGSATITAPGTILLPGDSALVSAVRASAFSVCLSLHSPRVPYRTVVAMVCTAASSCSSALNESGTVQVTRATTAQMLAAMGMGTNGLSGTNLATGAGLGSLAATLAGQAAAQAAADAADDAADTNAAGGASDGITNGLNAIVAQLSLLRTNHNWGLSTQASWSLIYPERDKGREQGEVYGGQYSNSSSGFLSAWGAAAGSVPAAGLAGGIESKLTDGVEGIPAPYKFSLNPWDYPGMTKMAYWLRQILLWFLVMLSCKWVFERMDVLIRAAMTISPSAATSVVSAAFLGLGFTSSIPAGIIKAALWTASFGLFFPILTGALFTMFGHLPDGGMFAGMAEGETLGNGGSSIGSIIGTAWVWADRVYPLSAHLLLLAEYWTWRVASGGLFLVFGASQRFINL